MGRRAGAKVTLVSRDNFFLLSPLLFEACSGVLDFCHCAQPIRPSLRRARFSDALNREVTYADIPPEAWERELKRAGLPEHLTRHLVTMAELHRAGRYDRMADGVERVTGRPAMSVREFVSLHAEEFGGRRS